jgi:hypothetical protein
MIHIRLRARMLGAWLCENVTLSNGGLQVSLSGIMDEYLEHQMVAMKVRKASYDEMGISHPLPGFTRKALDRELCGCQENFSNDEPIGQMPSLFFPEMDLYSVERICAPSVSRIPATGDTPSDKEWKKKGREQML